MEIWKITMLWARVIAAGLKVKNINDYIVLMRTDRGMYSRRGKISNIKYFYKLRRYLRQRSIINFGEELSGDFIMTINIIIPGWMKELIYRKALHK